MHRSSYTQLKLNAFGSNNQVGQVLAQMENISEGLSGIKEVLGQLSADKIGADGSFKKLRNWNKISG